MSNFNKSFTSWMSGQNNWRRQEFNLEIVEFTLRAIKQILLRDKFSLVREISDF